MTSNLLTKEDEILKLHMDSDGVVWYMDGHKSPISSGMTARQFIRPSIIGRRRVRVLGTPANASMIVALYHLHHDGDIGDIQLASPLVCRTSAEREIPFKTLYRMRQCRLPASLGGWHTMRPYEYYTYAMLVAIQDAGVISNEVRAHYHNHPAYYDLTFIEGVNHDACASLVATIRDPRFYIDPDYADRQAKLNRYLGLNPRSMRVVVDGDDSNEYHMRCRMALACWYTPAKRADSPTNFLYRIADNAGGGVKGLTRASQAFVTYLRYTWLNAVSSHPRYGGEPLFDPELFFKLGDEEQAWRRHDELRPRR